MQSCLLATGLTMGHRIGPSRIVGVRSSVNLDTFAWLAAKEFAALTRWRLLPPQRELTRALLCKWHSSGAQVLCHVFAFGASEHSSERSSHHVKGLSAVRTD